MKLRHTIFTFTLLGGLLLFGSTAFSYSIPDTVRVGLEYKYKETTAVPITNKSIIIGCENDGEFNGETEITGSSLQVTLPQGAVIDANEFYPSYNRAISACDDLNDMWEYSAAPAYVDDGLWGIYVYDTGLDSTSYAVDTLSGKSVNSSNIMSLTDSAIPVLFFDGINPQIEALDNGGIVTLSDRSYRGRIPNR